ncbi:hypothetical protein F4804DRAFT_329116 [Jackrogersella minutella]|nr:hypothetical protein F4804DRAFT_329116 [Jackrogersella minutella]
MVKIELLDAHIYSNILHPYTQALLGLAAAGVLTGSGSLGFLVGSCAGFVKGIRALLPAEHAAGAGS